MINYDFTEVEKRLARLAEIRMLQITVTTTNTQMFRMRVQHGEFGIAKYHQKTFDILAQQNKRAKTKLVLLGASL